MPFSSTWVCVSKLVRTCIAGEVRMPAPARPACQIGLLFQGSQLLNQALQMHHGKKTWQKKVDRGCVFYYRKH
eukprot:1161897-Pelagomonas_calceolata.AAC.5